MAYLKINGEDYSSLVSGLKVGYETLVSDKSGRNADGDTTIDIVNEKIKLYITLRHTTDLEMASFLNAIKPYEFNVAFRNPRTQSLTSIHAYTGTPEPEYYTIQDGFIIYKPMSINFIEK